jgi:hypothetical protein
MFKKKKNIDKDSLCDLINREMSDDNEAATLRLIILCRETNGFQCEEERTTTHR